METLCVLLREQNFITEERPDSQKLVVAPSEWDVWFTLDGLHTTSAPTWELLKFFTAIVACQLACSQLIVSPGTKPPQSGNEVESLVEETD